VAIAEEATCQSTCSWKPCAACGRGRPRLGWPDRWRVVSPAGTPPLSRWRVSAAVWRVTVVEESGADADHVVLRRVEMALALPNRE
jgi:hypothetical protein